MSCGEWRVRNVPQREEEERMPSQVHEQMLMCTRIRRTLSSGSQATSSCGLRFSSKERKKSRCHPRFTRRCRSSTSVQFCTASFNSSSVKKHCSKMQPKTARALQFCAAKQTFFLQCKNCFKQCKNCNSSLKIALIMHRFEALRK